MAHAFVKPQNIDAENAVNIHLFEATKTIEDKYNIKLKACCGNVNRKRNIGFIAKDTKNEARIYAAEQENNGNGICGTCVASLYCDNDS